VAGRLAGKVALVTGAASGIGRATALALAEAGAAVVAIDLSAPDLPGESLLCLAHDVTDETAWERAVAETVERFGGLDVLVNNAGIGGTGRDLLATSLPDWRRVLSVNLDGVFIGTRAAVGAMRSRRRAHAGSIVNVSSVLGLVGGARVADYAAAKGAVRLFTKAVAVECATGDRGIRVNSVHPGYIETPLLAAKLAERARTEGSDAGAMRAAIIARHPLGRLGRAEDVAACILFLASEEAAFVTGAELVVDGGYTAQ
jgi:3(or 17)beta-hydroxysteroid dehydrogenase